ncbi:hypothetical protein AB0B04_18505 [Streptomyces xinghaiensis]|uniref:Uncharacterized protein n=2 Tax=Streptomyces TaxID=1883 RepID=A0A3R7FPB7_9ACTN|nr:MULTISPECIES: hypothetical protein [Streptomyces]KNE78684.1 hypothetical protein ADZ36_31875 [Streptomyces fradiae]OFA33938.1 hypothetical protein BEN35_32045 [Streptomyces fradiae]PQM20718.1 hypothetical protein Sfr7A_26435 [Streptomyces xinghaiensis]RKM92659.1 hypothetical protein SFRA_025090 [Streptomyces xinghaiensis]RNC70628.1 hypothetical protein DC095_026080 [Streptomyces xinghaiensis]
MPLPEWVDFAGLYVGVARTAPSGADAALLAALAELGLVVSQARLERWRAAHYLLPHPRRSLGRGRGTASELREATVSRAAWLALASRQGRSLPPGLAWSLWAIDGTPKGLARLRAEVIGRLERYGRQLAPPATPAECAGGDLVEAGWQRRHDAAGRAARRVAGRDQHALLREVVNTATGDPNAVPSLPRVDDVGLAHVVARILAGGGEDVGEDEFVQAVAQAWPGQAEEVEAAAARRAAVGAAEEEWVGFPLAEGLRALTDAVRWAPDAALREAAELVTVTAAVQETVLVRLGPAALDGRPPPPPVLGHVGPQAMATVLADPVWAGWGRHMPLDAGSPAWPVAAAFHIALVLLLPGQAAAVAGYRARLQGLIRPPGSPAGCPGP